jgi:chromosome segregation ATPase
MATVDKLTLTTHKSDYGGRATLALSDAPGYRSEAKLFSKSHEMTHGAGRSDHSAEYAVGAMNISRPNRPYKNYSHYYSPSNHTVGFRRYSNDYLGNELEEKMERLRSAVSEPSRSDNSKTKAPAEALSAVDGVQETLSKMIVDFRENESQLLAHTVKPFKKDRDRWLLLLKQKQDEVARLDQLNSHSTLLQQQVKHLQMEVREKDAVISRLASSNEQLEKQLSNTRRSSRDFDAQVRSLSTQLQAMRQQMKPLQAVKHQLTAHSDQMSMCALALGKMAALLSAKDNLIASVQRDLKFCQENELKLSRRNDELGAQLMSHVHSRSTDEQQDLAQLVSSLQQQLVDLQGRNSTDPAALQHLYYEIESLRNQNESLRVQTTQMRAALKVLCTHFVRAMACLKEIPSVAPGLDSIGFFLDLPKYVSLSDDESLALTGSSTAPFSLPAAPVDLTDVNLQSQLRLELDAISGIFHKYFPKNPYAR